MKSLLIILEVARLLYAVELKAASVPEPTCPTRNLSVTCDDHLRLYIDGVEITDLPNAGGWDRPDSVDLPCTARLVAIHGTNGLGPGGILASTDDDFVLTNSTWKCSNVSELGWVEIDFDDSAWTTATEHGRNGEDTDWDDADWDKLPQFSSNAIWIWRRQWSDQANSTYEEMDPDVYCRRKLDPSYCTISPCAFGSSCIDEPSGGYCICAPGYTGQNCSAVINYCGSNPCTNGGSCLTMVDGYTCKCQPGYTGENCDYVTNNCESFPCLNGGTCFNSINMYMCICAPEWTGVRCDTLINPCDGHLCANGGTCFNDCGQPQCFCQPGWTGDLCFAYIDPCISNPCENGASCQGSQDGWICTCPSYFTGSRCEQMINLCEDHLCLNGGTCVFDCGDARCFCFDRSTGTNCETLITACEPDPCLNGGTCNNLSDDSFRCTCQTDWTGVRCESPNYDESLVCGSTLTWSQYDASNGFTRLCYLSPDLEDIDGRYIECRFAINGIPLYGDYTGLLKAGGNFGCVISYGYPEDLPVTSELSCADNYQQDISLGTDNEYARLMVCLRYPY